MAQETSFKPWFAPDQLIPLRDFFAVYTTNHEQFSQATLEAVLEDPMLGAMYRAISPEQARLQREQSLERTRRALLEGQWEEYETNLRRDGAIYAKMGIPYASWMRITRAYLRVLFPLMVKAYSSEPERLSQALIAAQEFMDRAVSILAESYLEAKEALVRDREQDLSVTLDCIGDAVITTDIEGRIQRMNPIAEKLTGWTSAECQGQPLFEVFQLESEETGEPVESPVERVLREGIIVGLANHTALRTRSGAKLPISDSAAPIRYPSGELRGVVLVFRDMTEERSAEDSLRKSQNTLAATLDSIHEGVTILDPEGNVTYANKMSQYITGLILEGKTWKEQAEIPGVYYVDGKTLCPPEQFPSARARRGEVVRDMELFFRTNAVPDGGVYLSLNSNLIRDRKGDVLGTVTSFRDVTHRRRLEEARAQSRQIQEASRLKSEFLANMSHELRTPLNSIIGFAELLHDGEVGSVMPKQKEFLGDILSSGRHLLQLINDILDLSKVEAGKMEFHPEQILLPRVVSEVTSVLRTVAASKNISLQVDISPEVREVYLDSGRLKQVLYNYLSNALKFTPEGGKVSVRALPEGKESLRLEVEDNGIGISREDLGRLFIEFQQLDSGTAKKHGGTGLGLSLTKRLVEAQGGMIGAHSTLGRGSTFYAILPKRALQKSPLPRPMSVESNRPGVSRILVVEDTPAEQERLVKLLVSAGYSVDAVSTGAQAIELFKTKSYDAVTLDLLLPDMNGIEVLQELQNTAQGKAPVIVITVITEHATAGFAVHEVLPKPLDGKLLLASLSRAGVPPEKIGKIFVIDDDVSSCKLMCATLEQLGYQTSYHLSAEMALVSALQEKPAAVILDLVMPGLDGFQFLSRFRQKPMSHDVPVLIWTNKDLTKDEQESLYLSAQQVIQKGAGTAELVSALRGYLPQRDGSTGGGGMANEPILIVDDSPTNMKLISFLLSNKGYQVQAASSAYEALELIPKIKPRLILMDLQMPGMDGLTLTRKLKSHEETRGITILAVTAYAMKGDEQKALEAGCDGYLTKPIDTRALPGIIAKYLAGE